MTFLCFLLLLGLSHYVKATTSSTDLGNNRAANFKEFKRQMFESYDKTLRPMARGGVKTDPTKVHMRVYILGIENISTSDQTMTSRLEFRMTWEDSALSWYSPTMNSSTEDIGYLLLRQDQVWIPDIIIDNSITNHMYFGFDDHILKLDPVGNFSWNPVQTVTTSCEVDVTFFPFDAQVCVIRVAASIMSTSELMVNMVGDNNGVSTEKYKRNGQWSLVEVKSMQVNSSDKFINDIYIQLRRRRAYYLLNLVLPICFLSLNACLVFALPHEAGEKMGMSLTILLAYAVHLTMVFDHLPKTSLQISIFIIWLTVLLAASSLSVLCSVFVLRIYHRDASIPLSSRTLYLTIYLRKLMSLPGPNPTSGNSSQNFEGQENTRRFPGNAIVPTPILPKPPPTEELCDQREMANENAGSSSRQNLNSGQSAKKLKDDWCRDVTCWKVVAETWDALLGRLFFFVVFSASLLCLGALIVGGLLDAGGAALP